VPKAVAYEQYDELLKSGDIDAVYIALPNSMHAEYAERAARAGRHVLCEKPMAVTEAQCELMANAARDGRSKLMIAYRLHFERAKPRSDGDRSLRPHRRAAPLHLDLHHDGWCRTTSA